MFSLTETCFNDECSYRKKFNDSNYLYILNEASEYAINVQTKRICKICNKTNEKNGFLNMQCTFRGEPCWFLAEIEASSNLAFDDIPKSITIDKSEFKLLCATYHDN